MRAHKNKPPGRPTAVSHLRRDAWAQALWSLLLLAEMMTRSRLGGFTRPVGRLRLRQMGPPRGSPGVAPIGANLKHHRCCELPGAARGLAIGRSALPPPSGEREIAQGHRRAP